MTFLISTILLLTILATKVYFFFFGKGGLPEALDYTSLGILVAILIFGIINYIKNFKYKKYKKTKNNIKPITKILTALVLFAFALSFFININKKSVAWDSVALYDARAKFLTQGINFSQMVDLSRYDPENSYYYVLYPPHTSVIHYYWYKLKAPIPVGVIYSILYSLLGITVYLFSKKSLGKPKAVFLTFLTVANSVVFSSSLTEYTNLPFALNMIVGIFLLREFIQDQKLWKYLYGTGLIITTMWIRFLEPLWVGVGLALLVAIYLKKKWSKQLFFPILMVLYGVVEYASWQSFVSSFGVATKIISFSYINLFEPIIGIFTGSGFSVLIFFIKSWGLIFLVYVFSILLTYRNNRKINFLQIFLLLTILIYYFGLYFVSFQSVWWSALGGSLVRGSTFMIPVSAYIILEYLHERKT